jgi:tRNA pseudouridine55 synthase
VVLAARRATGERRIGHAGTLDPFATGLLIVLTGRATRAQRWFMGLPKRYVTTARFGWTSTTGDPEGELTETGRIPPEPLVLPTGTIRQRPPAFSAIKIGGERAYAKARRGEEVDVPEREVQVTRFARTGPAEFDITCSSGTYVRSLIADLGDAYCVTLRRLEIGPFRLDEAPCELSLQEALGRVMPIRVLPEDAAADARHGRAVRLDPPAAPGELLLCDAAGPIAVAETRDGAEARVVVGFRAS